MKKVLTAMGLMLALAAPASAEQIYGLTNLQQIVTFDSVTRNVTSTVSPAGFSLTGEILLSIDVRPATGQLFGLSNQNRIFTLNPATGASNLVAALSQTPAGFIKSIDFNPTVDRIRVLGSDATGNNNLRANPNDGVTLIDGTLAFMAGDVNAGDSPAVVNSGYLNSKLGATTTALYDIEAGNDVLVTQNPANNGTLQTVGPLGFDVVSSGGFTGFDISGLTSNAYLVGNKLGTGGLTANSLYQVNLGTGAASLLGAVSGVNGSFRDIAVAYAVPEPTSACLLAFGIAFGTGLGACRGRRSLRRS
jgi:hypothetical protein